MKTKTLPLLLLLLCLSSQLLAQNPVLTLPASTFYLGDGPGSYTLSCPSGSSARVTAIQKIADIPPALLPTSPVTQPADGTVFKAGTGNTGQQVYIGTLPQSAAGPGYSVGVLGGSGSCYDATTTNTVTPSISFTITLAGISRAEEQARKSYALRANAITLPRLTTADQTTLPPQQAGNVVYNTDQQKMAVHNGTTWQYIAPAEASQFQNEKLFTGSTIWTVPADVTRILAEAWGGGAGGRVYLYVGSGNTSLVAHGGGAGGYARGFMPVTPGSSLTLTVGLGGKGASRPGSIFQTSGEPSYIMRNAQDGLGVFGGYYNGDPGSAGGTDIGFRVDGSAGTDGTISYGQRSATEYILLIQCGNGGTAYSAPPGGFGTQIAVLNSSVLLYQSGDSTAGQKGSFPGGGGGCGYNYGGDGASGMIVLHW